MAYGLSENSFQQNIRYANLTFCLSLIRVMAGGDEVVESLPGWQNNAIEKKYNV
jgi:hypothetical protein